MIPKTVSIIFGILEKQCWSFGERLHQTHGYTIFKKTKLIQVIRKQSPIPYDVLGDWGIGEWMEISINKGNSPIESSTHIFLSNIINRSIQITKSRQSNYWKLPPPFDHLGSRGKANAQRGKQPRDYKRQLGASCRGKCVRRAPGPREVKGTRAPKGSTR